MIFKIIITLLTAVLSGILGRMGGAQGYNTLYRDIGCSILSICIFCLWFGFKLEYWYLYLISFSLHWISFSTYYDRIFGYDNLWFSGFIVGLSLFPLMFVYPILLIYFLRAIVLAILWGIFNHFLPSPLFYWRHDIIEDFLRYFSVILTYLLWIIN